MPNTNLKNAKDAQNDEFYTQLEDIEAELKYYPDHFKGKTVFCNCDDPFESNFTLYFLMHFNKLGLKRLISTGYATSPIAGRKMKKNGTYCLDITNTKHALKGNQKDLNANDALQMLQTETNLITMLKGDSDHLAGDFRSEESLKLLEQADVVVGNPPFSLFREYIAVLVKYNVKYLFIGDINQLTYKEFFPLLKYGKCWMGATMCGTGSHWFEVPPTYQNKNVKVINGVRMMTNGRACWWTNLDYPERHSIQALGYQYNGHEMDYPKYDNYDAIDIGVYTKDGGRRGDFFRTPYDYEGIMGVPTTAFSKICPEQFEILGITQRNDDPYKVKKYTKEDYKNANDLNARGVIIINGVPKSIFPRILVRNRQPNRTDWETWQKEIDESRKDGK